MDVVMSMRHSTWVVMISSRKLSHLTAMSLRSVWMQKLNFSAIGIPKKKASIQHTTIRLQKELTVCWLQSNFV